MGLDPRDYRDRHKGADIYVLGSGPSLNHVKPSFFDGKTIVTANHGPMRVLDRVDYLVTKYHRHAYEYLLHYPGIPVVTTRHDLGNSYREPIRNDNPFIVLDHPNNTGDLWNASQWPTDPDHFIATWSTICTAMHWAAYLGAANIIMVGHDCGHIDDAGRVPGYREAADGVDDDDGDQHFWRGFDRQSREVKSELESRYGCNVVSLNPFINLNLEGHRWRSFAGTLNG